MDGDAGATVLGILQEQHAATRELLSRVADASGPDRQAAFGTLLRLLAVHEAAEELVLRPAAHFVVPRQVASARAGEERQVAQMLDALGRLETDGDAFDAGFAAATEALVMHLWFEEAEEWPTLETRWTPAQHLRLGAWVARAVERAAVDPAGPGGAGGDRAGRPDRRFSALREAALDLVAECRGEAPCYFETVPSSVPDGTSTGWIRSRGGNG